ncbi:hypothetical protein H4219_001126 [Mycoemilia scoparia]|uniref:SH3 domain-containing protein n=1 Tax=Mycoemilia scoparia TaxID=417184 RepID=A0A9W8A111_9FUNG|nr:hypothetical protein H4219_001126 [Mycoemilia scoparia]
MKVEEFVAEMDGDLYLNVGDIVEIRGERGGWYRGTLLNGTSGVFPAQNVAILSDEEAEPYKKQKAASSTRRTLPPVPVPAPHQNLPAVPPQQGQAKQETKSGESEETHQTPRKPLPVPPGSGSSSKPRGMPYIPAGAVPIIPVAMPPKKEDQEPSDDERGIEDDDVKADYERKEHEKPGSFTEKSAGVPSRPLPPPPPPLHSAATSLASQPPDLPPPPLPRRSNTFSSVEDREAPAAPHVGEDTPSDRSGSKNKESKAGAKISRLFTKKGKKTKSKDAGDEEKEDGGQVPDPSHYESITNDHTIVESADSPSVEEQGVSPNLPPTLPPIPQAKSPELPRRRYSRSGLKQPPPQIPPPPVAAPAVPEHEDKKDMEPESADRPSNDNVSDTDEKRESGHDTKDTTVSDDKSKAETVDAAEGDSKDDTTANAEAKVPKLATVLNDYEATVPEELNLTSDDVVTIIHQGTDDDPRWKGECHGRIGYFPGDVVELTANPSNEGGEDSSEKPKGFKLAAYGVKQGGLGSVLIGAGMPVLRKTGRTNIDKGSSKPAPPSTAPQVPINFPKLRSTEVPKAPKAGREIIEDKPETKEALKAPSFVSQETKAHDLPEVTVTKKDTQDAEDDAAKYYNTDKHVEPEDIAESPEAPENEPVQQQHGDDNENSDPPEQDSQEVDEPEEVSISELHQKSGESKDVEVEDVSPKDINPQETLREEPLKSPESDDSGLAPRKPPSLGMGRKVLRRGKSKQPTLDAMKQASEESLTKQLEEALNKDKEKAEDTAEEPVASQPILPPKPKSFGAGANKGIPLPPSGFQSTTKVGSAMASRIAALQRRLQSPGPDDNEDEKEEPTQPVLNQQRYLPPKPTKRTDSHPAASVTVDSVWQSSIDKEITQLKAEIAAISRPSNEESIVKTVQKQVVTPVEQQLRTQIQGQADEISAIDTKIKRLDAKILQESSRPQLTKEFVQSLVREQIEKAVAPLNNTIQALQAENKDLNKKIKELREYIDELTVEE